MSFLPKYSSPCELARKIPHTIAELLQADIDLNKRFREETISDLIVASIKSLPIENLVLAVPPEKSTGSDFDIAVISDDRLDAVQFRIQAKRLAAHPSNWEIGSYRELAHPHNSGGQSATLIRSSASEKIPTIPLYAFYNPLGAVEQAGGLISGLELASGIVVSKIIRELVRAKPKRPPYKRVGFLKSLFFPFTKLLCEPFETKGPDSPIGLPPKPHVFRQAVEKAIDSRYEMTRDVIFEELPLNLENPVGRPLVLPMTSELRDADGAAEERAADDRPSTLPQYLERVLDRAGEQRVVVAPVRRPKIILRSS